MSVGVSHVDVVLSSISVAVAVEELVVGGSQLSALGPTLSSKQYSLEHLLNLLWIEQYWFRQVVSGMR
jgi:hypothetical protein